MLNSGKSTFSAILAALVGFGCMAVEGLYVQAQSIPFSTAIPVAFMRTLEAGKVKAGEIVVVETTQVVILPDGQVIAKGTTITGHVIKSTSFVFDPAPYAI